MGAAIVIGAVFPEIAVDCAVQKLKMEMIRPGKRTREYMRKMVMIIGFFSGDQKPFRQVSLFKVTPFYPQNQTRVTLYGYQGSLFSRISKKRGRLGAPNR